MEFHDVGLHSSIPELGRFNSLKTDLPWDEIHEHKGIIEVHYLARGEQTWDVAGKEYHTHGGDLLVFQPGEKHGTGSHAFERMLLYWILIRVNPKARSFLNFSIKKIKPVLEILSGIHPESRVFKGSQQIRNLFDDVFFANANSDALVKPLAVSVALLRLILEITRCSQVAPKNNNVKDITAILKYIDESIFGNIENPALAGEDLAELANCSRSGLQVKFRQQTGMSPAEYILHKKIDLAKNLLSDGQYSVTEVAFRLGFSSSQYFATVFKKYTSKCPRDYLTDGIY